MSAPKQRENQSKTPKTDVPSSAMNSKYLSMETLKKHEKAALERLFDKLESPTFFHHQLFKRMKDEQLLRTPRPLLSTSLAGLASALLLVVAIAALSFYAGKSQRETTEPVATQPSGKEKFVLLVHNDDVPPADPSEQFQAYSKWLGDIKATRFADGEALHGDRLMLQKSTGGIDVQRQKLTQGNREEVSGFFVFEAADMEEATKIAQTCPHLDYKGTLELRQVFQ
jgi:hypothetical protein